MSGSWLKRIFGIQEQEQEQKQEAAGIRSLSMQLDAKEMTELVGKRCLLRFYQAGTHMTPSCWLAAEEYKVLEASPSGSHLKLRDRDANRDIWHDTNRMALVDVLD